MERDGLALVPSNGARWNLPDTVERRGMGSHRHCRVERDGPSTAARKGPSTAERRGIETYRYRRAERDGIAPTPQRGEGWPQHRRPERDGLALVPLNEEVGNVPIP